MKIIKRLWEKIVIYKYVSIGLHWGDATSYGFMGEPVGYKSLCKKMDYWELQYGKLDYTPLDRERWVAAGGYGREYKSQLKLRG